MRGCRYTALPLFPTVSVVYRTLSREQYSKHQFQAKAPAFHNPVGAFRRKADYREVSYFNEIYGDPELSARAKQVLLYLHDRANQDGESWYAIGTMAKDLSLSHSTIKRALAELIRQGRLEKRARYRENGGCTSNLCILLEVKSNK